MSFDASQSAQLAERRGTDAQILVLVEPRDRLTGEIVPLGFWTGDDHAQFSVDGENHLFFGAGAIIEVPPIRAGIGLEVRRHRVILPPLLDEVKLFLQDLRAAQARVRVWSQIMDLDTGLALGPPRRVIKGRLERAPETLGKIGDQSRTELVIASAARALTFAQPVTKSDAEMRLRAPADLFREHADVIGDIPIPWGQATIRPAMEVRPNSGSDETGSGV